MPNPASPPLIALLALVGYSVLVAVLFHAMERIEAGSPLVHGRREDRRAESAGIALVCAALLVAIVLWCALGGAR